MDLAELSRGPGTVSAKNGDDEGTAHSAASFRLPALNLGCSNQTASVALFFARLHIWGLLPPFLPSMP